MAGGLVAVMFGSLGAVVSAPSVAIAAPVPPGIVVKDGRTQPAFKLADAVVETVQVQTAMDSDDDGQFDKINATIFRPKETESGLKVASVLTATPYIDERKAGALGRKVLKKGTMSPATEKRSWLDEEFVPRGYASIEVEIAGTGNSEGCLDGGGPADLQSVTSVIDWLNGRASARHLDGTPAVASWSTGNVGMVGLSYAGTLAIQAAASGVAGLKTIVPSGAISSWYGYSNLQGIGYWGWGSRWAEGFAWIYANTRAQRLCGRQYKRLGDEQSYANGTVPENAPANTLSADYTPFFAKRDFLTDVNKMTASVFLIHGLADERVKTPEFAPFWEKLGANNVPRKLLLHTGGHSDPISDNRDKGGKGDLDAVLRWVDTYLYGLDNGSTTDPPVTIVDYPSGRRETSTSWPVPGTKDTSFYFGPAANGARGSLISSAGQGSQQFTSNDAAEQAALISDPAIAKDYRLAYLGPKLTSDQRLSGTGRVELTFTSATTSTPLTAFLVQYDDGQPTTVVARGSLDAKNRNSLSTPEPLVPGQQTTGTILLAPNDYTFPAGSQIGVILTGNAYKFVETDEKAGQVTVSRSSSRVVLPMVAWSEPPQSVCADEAWVATAVYINDNVVSHRGHRWQARWWNQNQEPGTTGQWGPWADLGAC